MFIKSLDIKNFRGIKTVRFDELNKINLFLGKNNSSKSSVLEALFLLIGSLTPEIILRINLFRSISFNEQDDFRLIFNGLNFKEDITIIANGDNEDFRELVITPVSSVKKTNVVTRNVIKDLNELDYDNYISDFSINELKLTTTIKQKFAREFKSSGKIVFQNGEFSTENAESKVKTFQRAVFVTQNLNLSSNLEKELENLIITKNHKVLVDVLKAVDFSIQDILLGHNRMIYVDTGMDRLIPINLLGDGVRRLLSVILAIYNATNGIVLIDEIDNGLHFSTLKSLWKSVVLTAEKCNVQVFVTTHNSETIKYLSECLNDKEFAKYKDVSKAYTIRKLNDGMHKSYGYDLDQYTNAVESEIELR